MFVTNQQTLESGLQSYSERNFIFHILYTDPPWPVRVVIGIIGGRYCFCVWVLSVSLRLKVSFSLLSAGGLAIISDLRALY